MGEAALLQIAAEQWGAFTRRQALRHIGRNAIQGRLRAGLWVRLQPGVYALAGAPHPWEQLVSAAILGASPAKACASHRTAAALWGWVERPASMDITVAFSRHHVRDGALVVHRSRHLPERDVVRRSGIFTTNAARTLVDVAGVLSRDELATVLDRALLARKVSPRSLIRHISTRHQYTRPGSRALRALLHDRINGVPESELERKFLRLVRHAGLPEPSRQYRIGHRRVDFAYPESRVAIELDGVAFHGSPSAIASDRRRQNQLVLAGWTVLRFGWEDVTRDEVAVRSIVSAAVDDRGG